MATAGKVRFWHDEQGWGVVDSDVTPGGCWAHFSAVALPGYRSLSPGQAVELEWEAFDQDGYALRARRVWPAGQAPYNPDAAPRSSGPDSTAFHSSLTIDGTGC